MKTAGQIRATDILYPPIEPWDWFALETGDGHQVYVEQCGARTGIPVVILHGGPGGGCSPAMRRFFDPDVFRVILFDQRGCGRSRPHAAIEANTTWDLVKDIEAIRTRLGLERWIVFGGSWGATLALIYAQEHPDRVAYLALRGVFLMTGAELDWFYRGGAARFWPEEWAKFLAPLDAAERADPIAAYHTHLFSGDHDRETRFARIWTAWENRLAALTSDGHSGVAPGEYARAFARLENHYFVNGGFLGEDAQILDRMARIAHIPAVIAHGRYDMICPPQAAFALAERWQAATLEMVPAAGHALSEPGIARVLVAAMDDLRGKRAALRV